MNDDQSTTIAVFDIPSPAPIGSDADWRALTELMASRWRHSIQSIDCRADDICERFFSQFAHYALDESTRIVLLPMGNAVISLESFADVVGQFKIRRPSFEFYIGETIALKEWANVIADSLQHVFDARSTHLSNGAISSRIHIVGSDSETQGGWTCDLPVLCHWLRQRFPEQSVEYAYLDQYQPAWNNELAKMRAIDSIHVVLPWRLNALEHSQLTTITSERLSLDLQHWDRGNAFIWGPSSDNKVLNAIPLLSQSSMTHLLMDKYLKALTSRSVERYIGRTAQNERYVNEGLRALDQRIDEMLPSEYRGRTDEVLPTSMGSASLLLDKFGHVAWDQIWTSFCDLAMAGGPPHRGKLLEAVGGDEVSVDLESYTKVVREIRRGIEMVTQLTTFESSQRGWVGISCDDEAMAVWLLRAIIVENVMVRREGSNLFVPAGPRFVIHKEIKNVITSVAKSVHYWIAHLRLRENELRATPE